MQSGTSVYMLTRKNVLMPGTFVGEVRGDNGLALLEVQSPQGKVYTTAPQNVFDLETGRIMLAHSRAEQMASEGYLIAVRNDGSCRVYQPAKHGANGGYIARCINGVMFCTCPAHAKTPGCCKHCQAVCSLLWNKARNARERGWKPGQVRYENLAVQIAADHTVAQLETSEERRARLMKSMDYDF